MDRLKLQTLELKNRIDPILRDELPRWGRGRVDTFNPYKAIQFNWDLDRLPDSELIGASDFPSLWNQAPREGMQLHWDGDNDSVDERNLSAGLGAGITPVTVDHAGLKRVRDWTWTLRPPAYPYAIDAALAARGADGLRAAVPVLPRRPPLPGRRQERRPHRPGRRHRSASRPTATGSTRTRPRSPLNQYALFPDSRYRFTRFRKTHGYANQPLDGIWLRGPFLHNGSVPTLRDLLNAPAERPAAFYRGYDVFDQARVGFVSDVAEAGGRRFTRYDTSMPGQRQHGARIRHRASSRRQGCHRGVPEDLLKRCGALR